MMGDVNKSSSFSALGFAVLLMITPNNASVYNNSYSYIPKAEYGMCSEKSTTFDFDKTNKNMYGGNTLSSTYIDSKESDNMMLSRQNRGTTMNADTIYVGRENNGLIDKGYYEIQEHENLNVAPRKTIELEGQVVSIGRAKVNLV